MIIQGHYKTNFEIDLLVPYLTIITYKTAHSAHSLFHMVLYVTLPDYYLLLHVIISIDVYKRQAEGSWIRATLQMGFSAIPVILAGIHQEQWGDWRLIFLTGIERKWAVKGTGTCRVWLNLYSPISTDNQGTKNIITVLHCTVLYVIYCIAFYYCYKTVSYTHLDV